MLINKKILKRIYKPIAIAVFVVVTIVGGAIFTLPILKDEAIKTHLKITDFHTNTLSDQITQIFNNINYTMDNLNLILNTIDDTKLLNKKFKTILSTAPYIRSISLLDEQKTVLMSSNSKNIGFKLNIENFYPKPMFDKQILRFGNSWIGKDFVDAQDTTFLKSVDESSSNFLPVLKLIEIAKKNYYVVININSDYFLNRYSDNFKDSFGYFELIKLDGTLLYSSIRFDKIGSKIDDSVLMSEAMQRGSSLGIESIDNRSYLAGYRLTKTYPLNVSFRSDYELVMNSWEEKQSFIINVLSSLVLFSIALVLALLYRYIREKELEIELHRGELESRRRYQTIFEQSSNFVVIMSSDAQIKKINNRAMSFLSLASDGALDKKLYELTNWSQDSKKWLKDRLLSLEAGDYTKKELLVTDAKKRERVVELTLSYIEIEEDFELYGSWVDVTETKFYEQEILKSKEMAERSNRLKSDFLANMSHEIRTPLNGIIGLTELVLKTDLHKMQREYLQKAQKSSYALLYVINDILDYSKVEAGKLNLERSSFTLSSIKESLIDLFEYQANKKGLTLDVSFPQNLFLIGDALRLRQVLTNLVGNAIKFTSSGSIRVDAKRVEEQKEDAKLLFCVKDSGIGMSDEVQKNIFMEFNQADSSITREYGGTGLGLAISKHLIALMGGDIWVKSKQGEGSEFSFTVSFSKDAEPKEHRSKDKKTVDFKPLKMIRGAKILLVEDNEINQIVAVGMIENLGLDADVAKNGKEAVDILRSKEYDLVLMDLQMPVMDGFESAREIREFNKEVPIVALSAAVLEEDIKKTLDSGMNEHLAKPIEQDELVRVFTKFISAKEESKIKTKQERETYGSEAVLNYYGVDIDDLKRRVGDEQRVIEKILGSFCRDYEDVEEMLDIENIDSEEFSRAIHALKGVSGNISLSEIYSLCKEIYTTKESAKRLSLSIELISKMKKTIKNLKSQLYNPDENEPKVRYSREDAEIFVRDLSKDLFDSRVVDSTTIDVLEQMLSGYMREDDISKLKRYLTQYHYEKAYELLEKNIGGFDEEI